MKKFTLILILISTFYNGYSQQDDGQETEFPRNEVRINGLYLVLGAFEGSYAYVLNDESTVGVTLAVPFDDDLNDDLNYYVSPYYRFFFGKKPAAGFFLEGFGMLNSVNDEVFVDGNDPRIEKERVTDFALGIGLGGKFMTRRGLVGEVNFGVGRNLFNSGSDGGDEVVGKIGVSIGYRF